MSINIKKQAVVGLIIASTAGQCPVLAMDMGDDYGGWSSDSFDDEGQYQYQYESNDDSDEEYCYEEEPGVKFFLKEFIAHNPDLTPMEDFIRKDLNGGKLDLQGAIRPTILPGSIGQLTNLRELRLFGDELTVLPEQIWQLKNLKVLDLRNTKCLTMLPDTVGGLSNLDQLNLGGTNVVVLPESIGQLKKLTYLSLFASQITTLPESVGQLTDLSHLVLSRNESFDRLSDLIDDKGMKAVLPCFGLPKLIAEQISAKMVEATWIFSQPQMWSDGHCMEDIKYHVLKMVFDLHCKASIDYHRVQYPYLQDVLKCLSLNKGKYFLEFFDK